MEKSILLQQNVDIYFRVDDSYILCNLLSKQILLKLGIKLHNEKNADLKGRGKFIFQKCDPIGEIYNKECHKSLTSIENDQTIIVIDLTHDFLKGDCYCFVLFLSLTRTEFWASHKLEKFSPELHSQSSTVNFLT